MGRAEIGAAWSKRSEEGRDYLSLKLDDPSFNAPIYANLFDDEGGEGYTLLWSGIANSVAPALFPKLPYDPIRDFTWITNLAKVPILIAVHPVLPARNTRELIALAKAKPGEISIAIGPPGGSAHVAAEMLKALGK